MGIINSISEWFERKNNKKLVEASVERTKQAESDQNKEPLNIMLKIADENPEIVAEFIQEIIKRKDISDRNVEKFLKEAPSDNIREAIKGIRTLDPKVNIKGEAAPGIAESLNQSVEDLDNPDLGKIMEAMEKVGESDMNPKQEEAFKEHKENLENQIKEEIDENQKTNKKEAKKQIESLKDNIDEKYWKAQSDFYSINNVPIRKFFKNNPDAEEINEFQKAVAELVSKKKARDFANYGSTIIFDGEENLLFEDMLQYNVPELTKNYYNQIPKEQKIYKVEDVKKQITELILRKIARRDALKYNKKEGKELYLAPVIPFIVKNNPDITPEEVKKYEDVFIQEMQTILNLEGNEVEKKIIRDGIEGQKMEVKNEKRQLINECGEIMNELPESFIKTIKETLDKAKDEFDRRNKNKEKKEEDKQKENEQR